MKTLFVNFLATDGIKLQGLLYEPLNSKNTIVIHFHGMAGSFYENSFIPIMADYYTKQGISFLSFNNRGHDYICDLEKTSSNKVSALVGGAAYEIIEESEYDIDGAISFVKGLGYTSIILQGHSSGANKIVYCMSKKTIDVQGIVLISPCDDIGLHIEELGMDKYNELISLAESFIEAGQPEKLMPENTFYDYWLSARTYLDCFNENSAFDTFPYRNDKNKFSMFNKIEKPIFVSFVTDGEFLLQPPEYVKDILLQKKSVNAELSFRIIEGASHSYTGKEKELTTSILDWIKNHIN